jgi:hypothetical protein
MNQALYAHMNNKRKRKKKLKTSNLDWNLNKFTTLIKVADLRIEPLLS